VVIFQAQAPYLLAGWLWFLGTLVPVIGIVQVGGQAMADRYAYIPLIGIFVAATWGIADVIRTLRMPRPWPIAGAGVAVVALCWLTSRQVGYWNDSYALWSHTLAVTPDNPVAENQMGMALISLNREPEAMQDFQKAIALGSHDPTNYLNLAAYLVKHGRQKDAIPVLETALRMPEDQEDAVLTHLNLGFAYTSIGDYDAARGHYRAALELDRNRVLESVQRMAGFVALHPSTNDYMKLGLLLAEAGQDDGARTAFGRVLQLDPSANGARSALSALRPTGR
jgi:protein O-mannosyl-transferase